MSESGERPPDRLSSTRFAIVPEWVLGESGDVVKLYAILDRYANKDARLWPGQVELAEKMRCSDRHVRTLLARLREVGAIEVVKRRFNGTTVYRLLRDRPERPEPAFLTDRNECSTLTGTVVPPNESQLLRAKELEPSRASDFDAFWSAYPRKQAKGEARKAWATATKKADPEVIVAGAHRYRNDPNREDAYTKHPGPWLRAECWEDEPLPPRVRVGSNGHKSTAVERSWANNLEVLSEIETYSTEGRT